MLDIHNPSLSGTHTPSELKCPTCIISFSTQAQHKQHYKSDHHRYNLKRKMVKLTPVSVEQFLAKKGQSQREAAQLQQGFKCGECGKKFSSRNTFDQHIRTKGHNSNMVHQAPVSKAKPEQYKKDDKVCLFCLHKSESFQQNLSHMQSAHSFFIPQVSFCKSPSSLILYLQQKIELGLLCILCENKGTKDFNSPEAVRQHMRDRGHCFMNVEEGYQQYVKYYDFSQQFLAAIQQQQQRQKQGKFAGNDIRAVVMEVVIKGKKQQKDLEDEGQWEDQNQDEEIKQKQGQEQEWESDQQQIEQKQDKRQNKASSQQKGTHTKTFKIFRPTPTATGELLLPNGKILGHRKYRHIYRQKYRDWSHLRRNFLSRGITYEQTQNQQERAIILKKKLMEIVKMDKLMAKAKGRGKKWQLGVGIKNNDLQKYFRTRNSL